LLFNPSNRLLQKPQGSYVVWVLEHHPLHTIKFIPETDMLFYVVTKFPPPYGGGLMFYYTSHHEQVHSTRSSCTAPEQVRKRSEFGFKYLRIRFAGTLRWKFYLFLRSSQHKKYCAIDLLKDSPAQLFESSETFIGRPARRCVLWELIPNW